MEMPVAKQDHMLTVFPIINPRQFLHRTASKFTAEANLSTLGFPCNLAQEIPDLGAKNGLQLYWSDTIGGVVGGGIHGPR